MFEWVRRWQMIRRIKKYENVVVYGAGGVGRKAAEWLSRNQVNRFIYAVSDKTKNPEEIEGILVKQMDEIDYDKKTTIVIVAVLPKLHEGIIQVLDQHGYVNRLLVDDSILKTLGVVEVHGVYPEKNAAFYHLVDRTSQKIFRKRKNRNVIIFESKIDYTDNCRALSEYIEKTLPGKYKLVWIVKEPWKLEKRKNITYISRYHISIWNIVRLNYYTAAATFIFFTHPGWLHSWNEGQRVINLGHGNPMKRAERLPGHLADCVLASGEDGVRYRKLEYQENVDVVVLGPPRNDWLLECGAEIWKPYIGSRTYSKIIVCFPTYKQYDVDLGSMKTLKYDSREENRFCLNTVHTIEELELFNRWLRERDVLLVCKEHYLQKHSDLKNMSSIIYLDHEQLRNHGHDLYQLLAGADALITDFSSIYMDYLLLDRPIAFFCNTREQYERGFTLENPESYMPGAKIYNNENLKAFITDVISGKDGYAQQRRSVKNLIFKYQDHNNCKRCVEYFKL